MRPFRYLGDPLFLVACGAYAVNRWWLKAHVHSVFLHSYFDDLLLIPCALPVLLWVERRLKLRHHDLPPQPDEMLFQLIIWSILFEWIGPYLMPHVTGDPWDVVAYAVGTLFAGLWWQRHRWWPRAVST